MRGEHRLLELTRSAVSIVLGMSWHLFMSHPIPLLLDQQDPVLTKADLSMQGLSPDPDQVAFREPVTRQPLYRVRFAQSDIWPEYAPDSKDTVDIEIHQPWLEAATAAELKQQQVSPKNPFGLFCLEFAMTL